MSKKGKTPPSLAPEDGALWHTVARDIRPLRQKKGAISKPAKKTTPQREEKAVPVSMPPAPGARPALSGQKPQLDRRTHDRVRRGKKAIEARIDLHGLTRATAHDRLTGFIRKCHAAQKRMLLVITGKGERGQGVLRSEVPRWLSSPELSPLVLTVEEAQIRDGGTGALYVYLRRIRS